MGFSLAFLKHGLLLAVASGVVLSSARAQSTLLPPGQAILFSSPESATVATNLSSQSPMPADFENAVVAPSTLNFDRAPAGPPMSLGPPVVSSAEESRLQDLLDRRNNWMLLTPAEIYGVTTPEMILGISERDAFGQRIKTTALERYTERQNQTPAPANPYTNGFTTWNAFGQRPDVADSINGGLGGPAGLANPSLNPSPDKSPFAAQNANNNWSKLFGSPAPVPLPGMVPSIAQQTEMERFKQLLMSGSSSEADAAAPSMRGMKIYVPQSPLDSSLGSPAISPVGGSFAPLSEGIGRPAGLPKLPGGWNLSLTSAPPAAAWAPQPPPWLLPQPFAVPQRKF